jgi:hypothetical protein
MTVATLIARNGNEAVVAPTVGSGEASVWLESGFSRRKNVSYLIYFIKKCYKLCTLSSVCKDNAATNCITYRHKKKIHSRQL